VAFAVQCPLAARWACEGLAYAAFFEVGDGRAFGEGGVQVQGHGSGLF
jgi:hypothetical protein